MMSKEKALEVAECLINRVKSDGLTLTITIDADERVEIMVSPYESYHPTCPYAHERRAEEDDGK